MSNRFFRHRELHVALLALLAERPMHGYELMGELVWPRSARPVRFPNHRVGTGTRA